MNIKYRVLLSFVLGCVISGVVSYFIFQNGRYIPVRNGRVYTLLYTRKGVIYQRDNDNGRIVKFDMTTSEVEFIKDK